MQSKQTHHQRWAVMGLGAQANAIATALKAVPGTQLVGCASSSVSRAEEFGRRFGCPAYSSHTDLLGASFDVVVVAGVNALHAELSVAALQAGSAVLCEKPLALSAADASRILDAANAAGRPVFTGYHLRFQALADQIRQAVLEGEIGEVKDIYMQRYSEQVSANVRPWRDDLSQAGAGVLCDVAVHLFDYVTWVTGQEVVSVGAVAMPPRASGRPDEHVVVDLELHGGALAVVDAARSLPCGDNALHLHGSLGSICTGPLRWTDRFQAEVRQAKGKSRILRAEPVDPLVAELTAVRDTCWGAPAGPLATGLDGLRGAATLEAAIQSLETGELATLPRGGTAGPASVSTGQMGLPSQLPPRREA